MAEELYTVTIKDNFYRDGFGKVLFVIFGLCINALLLVLISLYLYSNQPSPVVFNVGADWRVQPPVPIDQPYLSDPDLVQWVSDTLPKVFVFDFMHYEAQLKAVKPYFTPEGYQTFLNELNNYASYSSVQTDKSFIYAEATGAPSIINKGLSDQNIYFWRVQMPIEVYYEGGTPHQKKKITFEVIVGRVPTLDNLNGVAISNISTISIENQL